MKQSVGAIQQKKHIKQLRQDEYPNHIEDISQRRKTNLIINMINQCKY